MVGVTQNTRFVRVGRGTPMGELLRRYWHPVAAIAELSEKPIKPIRLLGEDLVLYRSGDGTIGLVERHCPHRRADLANAIIEPNGIRCSYHGWCFSHDGTCLEQPFEDIANPRARFREKIKIQAHRTAQRAGMVWAYLGPEPAPLVPNWEPFTWRNGFTQVVFADVPCNWFQCQENSLDPVHFEWMHRNYTSSLQGSGVYGPRHMKLAFEEFEFGHIYRRVREDTDETNQHWTVGVVALWPNAFFLGDHIEWRVPVDDENTLSITWMFHRVPKEKEPYEQQRVPFWKGPIRNPDGSWVNTHVLNQDIAAWVGQGVIADRTQEHLGQSDLGIVMMRRAFEHNMKAVEDGEEPKGLIHDEERNRCLELPIKHRELFTTSMSLEESRAVGRKLAYRLNQPDYHHQVGQPAAVKREYQIAMGIIPPDAATPVSDDNRNTGEK